MPPSPRGFPPAPPRHRGQPQPCLALPPPVPALLGALAQQSWAGWRAVCLVAAVPVPSAELLRQLPSPGLQSVALWIPLLLLLLGAVEKTGSSYARTGWWAVYLQGAVACALPFLGLGCPAEAMWPCCPQTLWTGASHHPGTLPSLCAQDPGRACQHLPHPQLAAGPQPLCPQDQTVRCAIIISAAAETWTADSSPG